MDRVEEFIAKHFPHSQRASEYYIALWKDFSTSGLADGHFVRELTSGEAGKFEQRIWEMVLARRLKSRGHSLASSDSGPDFRLSYEGRTIWIEAISPTPKDVPAEWLAPPRLDGKAEAVQVPFNAILLRWTASLKEKGEKLAIYKAKGIVADQDVYIIAIDPSQLTTNRPLDEGASRLPFAVETVFPIGPIGIPISPDGKIAGKAIRTVRYSIENRNKARVPTDSFLNPDYAGVSAVVSASTVFAPAESLRLTLVHNPLARNRLPQGLFGPATTEWVPTDIGGGEFELRAQE